MRDSTGPTVGNIVKAGAPFIHNFGFNNTFIGSGAGNFTMTHPFGSNTATGFQALHSNINGFNNTASGDDALSSNTTGNYNTAFGSNADVLLRSAVLPLAVLLKPLMLLWSAW